MQNLLQMVMTSKALQKYGFAAAAIMMGLFVLNKFGMPYSLTVPIVLVAVLLLWGYSLFLKGLKKKKTSAFDKGLVKDLDESAGGKVAAKAAQKELVERWKQATAELKASGLSLYDLPWYLLVGEPQSGKSTTLQKSGLEFPVGTEALSGAGGTRNCDWWFTDEAVILDTAGRFTFQEKNAPDAAEWKTFLDLLGAKRPHCPIDGVLLVIPCTSLLGDSAEEREQKAANIRERLSELQRDLGIQFPVYVLITKSDQMLGFTEFFTRLPAREQRQLFGWSMQGPFAQPFDAEQFGKAYHAVWDRVHRLRLKLLAGDTGLSETDKFFVFPEELKAAREPLQDYLKTIFMKTQYLPPLFFRGFYFTSGAQEGKPIARACASMLRTADGKGSEIIENLAQAFSHSKAFFIRDFYAKKVFRERNMIVHSQEKEGVNRRVGTIAIGATLALILITGGFLTYKLRNLHLGVTKVRQLAEQVNKEYKKQPMPPTEFKADEKDKPSLEGLGSRTEWLKLASAFSDRYNSKQVRSLLNDAGVQTALREIHWMFFFHNLLYPQGEALRQRVAALKGAKKSVPAEFYDQYASLWSADYGWRLHTIGGEGVFQPARDENGLAWRLPHLFDESAGQDAGDVEGFRKELELVRKELLADDGLNFTQKPDYGPGAKTGDAADWPPHAAIRLPLVGGDPDPVLNDVIWDGVKAIAAGMNVSRRDVQDVVNDLGDAVSLIRGGLEDLEALTREECGCFGPVAELNDPAPRIEELLEDSLEKGLENLQTVLKEKQQLLRVISFQEGSEDELRTALLKQLEWVKQVKGQPGQNLKKMVDERLTKVIEERKVNAKDLGGILQRDKQILDFIDLGSQTTPHLRAGYDEAREGVGLLLDLVKAQRKKIEEVYRRRPRQANRIDSVIDDFKDRSPQRKRAMTWAREYGELEGAVKDEALDPKKDEDAAAKDEEAKELAAAWKLKELAKAIELTVKRGDESIRVHCWLAFVEEQTPKILLTEAAIRDAAITRTRVPEGARASVLKDALPVYDELEKTIGDEFDDIEDLLCLENKELIDGYLKTLKDTKKKNVGNFIDWWFKAYETWQPDNWMTDLADWGELKNSDYINTRSKFWDEVRLNLSATGTELSEFVQSIDPNIGRMKGIWDDEYSGLQNTTRLRQDLQEFVNVIKELPADRAQAWEAIYGAGSGSRNQYLASIKALDKYDKLANVPETLKRLLDPQADFEKSLATILEKWRPKFSGAFPFEAGRITDIQTAMEVADGVILLNVKQASLADLKTFLSADLNTIATNPYYLKEWSKQKANEPAVEFFKRCTQLREFWFDAEGNPRAHTLEVVLPQIEQEMKAPAESPTDMKFLEGTKIVGAEDKFQEDCHWRLRNIVRDDSVRKFTWLPSDYSSSRDQFTIRLEHEGSRIPTANIRIPGAFSFFAFAYCRGAVSSGRKGLTGMNVPVRATGQADYQITFDFLFTERPIPALPDWGSIDKWLGPAKAPKKAGGGN